MLASTEPPLRAKPYTAVAAGPDRGPVTILDGCVMEGLLGPTNEATTRTLTVNGYRIVASESQGCCGALHAHAGDAATARDLARANIAAFEIVDDC